MKGNRLKSGRNISSFFSIILFLFFAFCMIFVMAIGANVYQNIVSRMKKNFTERTGVSYIANKAHQFDRLEGIFIKTLEGKRVLELNECVNAVDYHTLIYWMDGEIKELYKAKVDELSLEAGIGIVEAEGVEFLMVKDNLLQISVEGPGGVQSLYINIRSGGEYE